MYIYLSSLFLMAGVMVQIKQSNASPPSPAEEADSEPCASPAATSVEGTVAGVPSRKPKARALRISLSSSRLGNAEVHNSRDSEVSLVIRQ
jgi:hypothetical protein